MKIEQKKFSGGSWSTLSKEPLSVPPQLVLVFGGSEIVREQKTFDEVKGMYPDSHIILMSTAGEIADTSVSDKSLSLVAVHFEKTTLAFAEAYVEKMGRCDEIGKELANKLPKEGLVHVMVFSEGLRVNGTKLVAGMTSVLPPTVALTGGLVGDGADFKHTYVGLDGPPQEGKIVAIGFYGDSLLVSYGSRGGWDPFGPERIVTKSKDNVLYELDGKPALDLYKEYLGDKAKDLPGSGLLFPLNLKLKDEKGADVQVVRTILAVDEQAKSLTFAGTIPEGIPAQLMKANFDRLVSGASGAADMISNNGAFKAQLAILISCIGRKLVLQARIEEEVEAIRDTFGEDTVLTGFYSYGEISPIAPTEKQCQLHNQTMTITALAEK